MVLAKHEVVLQSVSIVQMPEQTSLALPDPRRRPVIAYSMNARRERVWDTTVPRFVLAPPELGWAIIG